MWTPEVQAAVKSVSSEPQAIAILGIEAHICVTQTTLDLLRAGHSVYVLVDGVSSCNAGEVGVALARLRQAGATVTTSESWLYEVVRDADRKEFKQIAGLVKEFSAKTKEVVEKTCRI
jgi:isochorismate hydrolase